MPSNKMDMSEINKYSKTVTQDPTQPAAQAMLHAAGLTKDDFKKAYPRWDDFLAVRQKCDPQGKLLNEYLKTIFA